MRKILLLFVAHYAFLMLSAQPQLPSTLRRMPAGKDSLGVPVERRTSLSALRNSARNAQKNILVLAPSASKTKDQDVAYLGKLENKDVYKVNIPAVVSKYAGETEKNLEIIFNDAARSNGILFFDEANALFSKAGSPESTINYIDKLAQSKKVTTVFWCEEDCLTWLKKSKHAVMQ